MAKAKPHENGHFDNLSEAEKRVAQLKLGRAFKVKDKKQESEPDDPEFKEKYPLLFSYLCYTRLADEFEADPPRLQIVRDGSYFRAGIQDESLQQGLAVTGNTITQALERLNAAIGDPESTWSYWKKRGESLRSLKREAPEK